MKLYISHHLEGRLVMEFKLLSQNHNMVIYWTNQPHQLVSGRCVIFRHSSTTPQAQNLLPQRCLLQIQPRHQTFPHKDLALFQQMMQYANSLAHHKKSEILPPSNLSITPLLLEISRTENAHVMAEFWAQTQGCQLRSKMNHSIILLDSVLNTILFGK